MASLRPCGKGHVPLNSFPRNTESSTVIELISDSRSAHLFCDHASSLVLILRLSTFIRFAHCSVELRSIKEFKGSLSSHPGRSPRLSWSYGLQAKHSISHNICDTGVWMNPLRLEGAELLYRQTTTMIHEPPRASLPAKLRSNKEKNSLCSLIRWGADLVMISFVKEHHKIGLLPN